MFERETKNIWPEKKWRNTAALALGDVIEGAGSAHMLHKGAISGHAPHKKNDITAIFFSVALHDISLPPPADLKCQKRQLGPA